MKQLFKQAVKITWYFYSAVILTYIILTITVPDKIILNSTPQCKSFYENGTECSFCGLSRGIISISNGNISEANNYNKASIPIYIFFLLNSIIAAYFTIHFLKKSKLKGTNYE